MDLTVSLKSWKIAAGFEDVPPPNVDAPKIELKDGGAEANKAMRRQLLDTLSGLPCLSVSFFNKLSNDLGFGSDLSLATKPLEARQVRQLIQEAETESAIEQQKAVQSGVAMTQTMIQEAFQKDVDLAFEEVLVQLMKTVPPEGLSDALKASLKIFTEEMRAHLEEARVILRNSFCQLPKARQTLAVMNQALGEVRQYAEGFLNIYQRAMLHPDDKIVFEQVKALLVCFTVLNVSVKALECITHVRAAIALERIESLSRQRKVQLAAVKERLEALKERIEEMLKAFLEKLEEEEEADLEDAASEVVLEELLADVSGLKWDEIDAEMTKMISGFESRVERLQAAARSEVTGHITTMV